MKENKIEEEAGSTKHEVGRPMTDDRRPMLVAGYGLQVAGCKKALWLSAFAVKHPYPATRNPELLKEFQQLTNITRRVRELQGWQLGLPALFLTISFLNNERIKTSIN